MSHSIWILNRNQVSPVLMRGVQRVRACNGSRDKYTALGITILTIPMLWIRRKEKGVKRLSTVDNL